VCVFGCIVLESIRQFYAKAPTALWVLHR